MLVQTWGDVLVLSFQQLWGGVVVVVPKLIIALVVFIIGWIIAVALGKVVEQIIKALKVDMALKSLGMEDPVSRAGMKLDSGAFIGGLVRWFFILVFVLAAFDVLGLSQVTEFLRSVVLAYIPQVIVAALILVAAALLADTVNNVVEGGARAAHLPSAGFLGGVAKWSIWIFAILAALFQLGIAGPFVQTIFTAFVAMVALAGGLAFGLGGKEAAARYLEKLRSDISNNR
ncbi:MAG: Small-conductance mechanosensitive ion channel-like protein [Candidatus Giovannonibacteria bacterium GW2011_GWC2_44_9]|uniref:Small-conductance mechanosensitive ion channel-like protein n=3 Tax=Candidatus Giovannoniibacteriota TaxID=1752738 RepID=A0A0G1IUT6_9BACT|nr:MAG: Small-conductance mechanosensitive ion channel-like protein [Candidatus Giovannonibacteria bacterium GW2011_GWB1_44_23]KKT62890.1 MAG: Small-conductance mechanosensitive ion channel-like protein [Candidatus Giovannonibacteria bacterium GW2011_GWA1_44_29]KKT83395.1 MAG: Small-conductance mechanosensitive ion channel-like protein [Candidatus Giovannonibacteria bacterium GW2011_GWC2_44_9]KKT91084.1 MAG: Small-conductance mechanosensitive ion channel-like protein [Parcubacteria group bacteri